MDEKITLTLEDPLLRAAHDVATQREISVQQLLKDALKAELTRAMRARAKSPNRADERMLAMLRARFADDLAFATSWGDLHDRLIGKGVCLREAGGGLAVFSLTTGARICKGSDLGASLQTLTRRFRAPFPGAKSGSRAYLSAASHSGDIDIIIDSKH